MRFTGHTTNTHGMDVIAVRPSKEGAVFEIDLKTEDPSSDPVRETSALLYTKLSDEARDTFQSDDEDAIQERLDSLLSRHPEDTGHFDLADGVYVTIPEDGVEPVLAAGDFRGEPHVVLLGHTSLREVDLVHSDA